VLKGGIKVKRILSEILEFKRDLLFLVLNVVINTFGLMALPGLQRILIDDSIPNKNVGDVIIISGEMLIFTVIIIVTGIFVARFAARIAMGVGRNLRSKVFAKVQSFSQQEIDSFSTSSLITRTNSDIRLVQNFLVTCLQIAVEAPIITIFGIVKTVQTSVTLSRPLLFAIPTLIVVIIIIGKIAIPLSGKIQIKLDKINMIIREKLTGVRVIRAFGTNEFEEKRFDNINVEYSKMNKKMQYATSFFMPAIYLILAGACAAVMHAAYVYHLDGVGTYTTGEVMAVIQYVMQILFGVTMVTVVLLMLPRAVVAATRAQEVLDSVNLIKDPDEPKENVRKHGYLEFKDVSFTYNGADVPAIKDLSFKAGPGEITAIIGGTGMGKSTIVNLIPRLYDVSKGQVLVDGIDVRDYKIKELRKKVGFVPQKALLFKGTIESNLRFGDEDPTEERIEKAVKIAQSYDFVMKKEGNFASDVAQGGQNFSGGQKQRLCIARAIVRKPEIYVFDDSFSALDFKTDKALRKALKEETENATTVIVAQRVSTIMDADRIIVIENGEVAGIGTHRELLKKCKVYQEIVSSQLSKEEMKK